MERYLQKAGVESNDPGMKLTKLLSARGSGAASTAAALFARELSERMAAAADRKWQLRLAAKEREKAGARH